MRPYLALAALWLLYFHPLVLHPAWVLYADYSDYLAEHLPAKIFLARVWRETGELPLWNPYHHAGSPFVHDIQVGVFYPPYAVTYVVPEAALGAALSWVIALHVLLAGVGALVYARSHGLGELGSLIAGAGFMLSAKWQTHLLLAGHTITVGLAWLPFLLLWLERAIRTREVLPVLGTGVVFALILLGTHTQWAFYAGVFAAAWTFRREHVRRWLACGLGAAVIAVALCAVQLLPTWEAAGQSARTVGLTSTLALPVGALTFMGMIGPSLSYDPPRTWEMRALFGLFWVTAALASFAVARAFRWQFWVFVGLIAFSLGGAVLIEWLPGFNVFRIPSRMLLIATFPLAFLAGVTTDALTKLQWDDASRTVLRKVFVSVVVCGVLPTLFYLFVTHQKNPERGAWGHFIAYWVVVVLALPAFAWLVLRGGMPHLRTATWAAVLLAELFVPVAVFPQVKRQEQIYPASEVFTTVTSQIKPGTQRVLDRDIGGGEADKLALMGVGAPQAMIRRVESMRGYNPLDVLHFREFLGFILDDPTPVLALSPVAQPIVPNYEIGNRTLFDLTNTSIVIVPDRDPLERQGNLVPFVVDPSPPLVPAIPPNPPPHLPPHLYYRNRTAMPRVFVVPQAAHMPKGGELAALKACDFRQTVLLTTTDPLPPRGKEFLRLEVSEYRSNTVVIPCGGGTGGVLFLGDVWFPGWTCRVDGNEVPVYRANHAFRAVALPDGAKEVVFTFEPRSYRVGWWVSLWAVVVIGGLILLDIARRLRRVRLDPRQAGS
jgi:hypothetical protein